MTGTRRFLLSIFDSNESIDFVQAKSNFFIEVLDELRLFIDKKATGAQPRDPADSNFFAKNTQHQITKYFAFLDF
jgi:hypothetical protein